MAKAPATVGMNLSRKETTINSNVAFMYGRKQGEADHDPDKRAFAKSNKFVDRDQINSFTGDYAFLSPTFPCPVEYKNSLYPSFQHALEASKLSSSAADKAICLLIIQEPNIREVKRFVKHVDVGQWKEKCLAVAEDLMRDKFLRNKQLRKQLMSTDRRSLVYTNDHGDQFWGVSEAESKGQNRLGRVLEAVRAEIASGEDLERWVKGKFRLEDGDKLRVDVSVWKEGREVEDERRRLEGKSVVYFGKAADLNDVVAAHASVSGCHCLVVVDAERGALLVDLHSVNGTRVNEQSCEPYKEMSLDGDSLLRLGASSRCYRVHVHTDADVQKRLALYEKMDDPGLLVVDAKDTTVYVGNLAYAVTEAVLRELFCGCGPIREVKLPREREVQGQTRGFAFIVFETVAGLQQALRLDGDELMERVIRVKRSMEDDKKRPLSSTAQSEVRSAYKRSRP